MATTTKETITVTALTKYGFQAGGIFYGYSPRFKSKEGEVSKVVPGRTLEVEVYTSDGGKKYINSVVSVQGFDPAAATQAAPAVASTPPPAQAKTAANVSHEESMRKIDDRQRKEAVGKTRCAAINAAIQSPALVAFAQTEAEYILLIQRIADVAVKYTFEEK